MQTQLGERHKCLRKNSMLKQTIYLTFPTIINPRRQNKATSNPSVSNNNSTGELSNS